MTKFFGPIGYGESVLVSPGVWEDQITERDYYGDILQNIRKLDSGDRVLDSIVTQNRISVVADAYALNHFFEIRYVRWAGTLWKVTSADVKAPRLILTLGEVYNGPKVGPPQPIG